MHLVALFLGSRLLIAISPARPGYLRKLLLSLAALPWSSVPAFKIIMQTTCTLIPGIFFDASLLRVTCTLAHKLCILLPLKVY